MCLRISDLTLLQKINGKGVPVYSGMIQFKYIVLLNGTFRLVTMLMKVDPNKIFTKEKERGTDYVFP